MSVHIQRKPSSIMAQVLHIREHTLVSDSSLADGGEDAGPDPHELYNAALGACKALTVMWYARKKGLDVQTLRTEVESDRSQERAGIYKLSTVLHIGGNLTDAQLAELEVVAGKCPVHKLMSSLTTEIATRVERAV